MSNARRDQAIRAELRFDRARGRDPAVVGADRQPISRVLWVPPEWLRPNGWNPNHVFDAEMDALALSILTGGWLAAIVVDRVPTADQPAVIIDGFHRWSLAVDPAEWDRILDESGAPTIRARQPAHAGVRAAAGGLVPVIVRAADAREARITTVTMNRARGRHAVGHMADLVASLLADGMSEDDVCARLGMEPEELDVLADRRSSPERNAAGADFGRGWVPIERER